MMKTTFKSDSMMHIEVFCKPLPLHNYNKINNNMHNIFYSWREGGLSNKLNKIYPTGTVTVLSYGISKSKGVCDN